jgi:hypothetical protein
VFQGSRGGVLRNGNFHRRTFGPAAIAIGEPRLTPHGLRHTAASLAIAAGGNVKVVQQMLGQATASMTLDLYGHLFPDQLDDVADRRTSSAERPRTFLRTICGLTIPWILCNGRRERPNRLLTAVKIRGPGRARTDDHRGVKRNSGEFLTCTFTLKRASELHGWCRIVSVGDQRCWVSCGLLAD